MVITLVGLSGCGKSYLAKRLEQEKSFRRICCDDLIENKLFLELQALGLSSIEGVAKWMGEPYEKTYREREERYLDYEREVMKDVIQSLGQDGWGLSEDIVVDTTGSVVYLGDEILSALKRRSRIIYLLTPEKEYDFMLKQYISDPKPVIWGESFSAKSQEANEEAVARCYTKLIEYRAQFYCKFADVTIIMNRGNRDNYSVGRLLRIAGAQ